MAKKNTVPTCLGHYDRGDTVCDGDPEGATEEERMICAWRDRCGGFKAHLDATGEAVVDYVEFEDDDNAVVPDRDKFAAFCQKKAEAFGVVDGLPTKEPDDEDEEPDEDDFEEEDEENEDFDEEDEDEGEDDEDEEPDDEEPDDEDDDGEEDEEPDGEEDEEPDGEEDGADAPEDSPDAGEDDVDLDQLDDDEGDGEDVSNDDDDGEAHDEEDDHAGEASTVDVKPSAKARKSSLKKKKSKKKSKKKPDAPKGERETNSKWAAQQRRESLALYKHFEEALAEGLNGFGFAEPKQAAIPGQLYVADRRELSGYVSIYCKTAKGRDVPVVSIKMKARLTEIDVDLPVTVKMLRARLSKAKLAKLEIKQLKGGRFRARMVGLDKEKAAIVAEVVHELVRTEAIKLPSPLWA